MASTVTDFKTAEKKYTTLQGYISNDKVVSLDGMIYGMPPSTHVSDNIMNASMPQATIIPCEPEFSSGLSLFRLDEGKGSEVYKSILKDVGFNVSSSKVKVAYLADNFPTDTFNNEYGETFLDKFAQAASSGLGDLSQMAGWRNFEDAEKQMSNLASGMKDMPGANMVGSGWDKIQGMANNAYGGLNKKNQQMISSMGNTMKALVTGSRVDFPQVWKNSSYSPSYSMTIRLYNPNPGDAESTRKYIVGPIAALVALGVPKVSEDSTTYKWPLICKVRSPGIYHLNAAYINSISVIKGGDQQSIAYNQNLAMCDVRIDFGSLYNSILAGKGSDKWGERRPTLGTYLESLGGRRVSSASQKKENVSIKAKGDETTPTQAAKKNSANSNDTNTSDSVDSRVSTSNSSTYADLVSQGGR